MARPCSGREQKTAPEDVEVIRHLAVRYGDDAIAVVLNKLGRRTGKEKRWNAQRVRTARSTYAIPGHSRTVPDPEILTLGRAAKHCGVSQGTIRTQAKGRLANSAPPDLADLARRLGHATRRLQRSQNLLWACIAMSDLPWDR